MQKLILKNNKRFQILNVLTDLVDVFSPKLFEPGKVRVRTRKKKRCMAALEGWMWPVSTPISKLYHDAYSF